MLADSHCLMLSYLSYTARTQLPRAGGAHSSLHPPELRKRPTDKSGWSNPSAEIPCSPGTLGGVTLAIKVNQDSKPLPIVLSPQSKYLGGSSVLPVPFSSSENVERGAPWGHLKSALMLHGPVRGPSGESSHLYQWQTLHSTNLLGSYVHLLLLER